MSRKLIIVLIIALATFVRFYKLSEVPPSYSWDEAAIGYDAYSIAQTGKDQWGEKLPLAFKSFGEYKLPFHIYTTAIIYKLFGFTVVGVRFGSAVLGVVNVYLLYLIVKKWTANVRLSLAASFFLAISPWHIQFSRVSWETNYALLFFLLGLLSFIGFVKYKKRWYLLLLSSLFFSLTLFTYNAAKVFVPLFLTVVGAFYFKKLKNNIALSLTASIIILMAIAVNLFTPELSGMSRLSQLSLDPNRVVSTKTYYLTNSVLLSKFQMVTEQYIAHFDPVFLFISGDPNPRHSSQIVGQFYIFDLVFILLGVVLLVKRRNKFALIVLAWFFMAFLPSSIVREYPHASRSMFALGGWQIVSALGLLSILDLKVKFRLNQLVTFFVILGVFINYFNYYVNEYPNKYSQYWQYGYKQVFEFIKDNYDKYDKIVITRKYGEPQIFALFYMQYNPEKYLADKGLVRQKVGDWVVVGGFDKFIFIEDSEMLATYNKLLQEHSSNTLMVGGGDTFPENVPRESVVRFLDESVAFEIVKI